MPLFDFTGNAVLTTLDGGISDTDTSLTLTDPTGWPDGTTDQWTMTLDEGENGLEEKLLCGLRTGSSVAILQRGYDDTIGVAHQDTALAKHTISAVFAKDVSQHVHTTSRDDHTQYLNNTRHDDPIRHPTASIADNAITTAKLAGNAVGELVKVGNEVRAIAATSAAPSNSNALLWFDTDDDSWHIWDGSAGAFAALDLDLMLDPPACSVFNSGAQLVPDTSTTTLFADSETFDNDNMHSTLTNSGRITAQTAGRYLFTSAVSFDLSGTGLRRTLYRINGTTDVSGAITTPNVGGGFSAGIVNVRMLVLGVGDYVEVRTFHTAGSSLNVFLREFTAFRLGKV